MKPVQAMLLIFIVVLSTGCATPSVALPPVSMPVQPVVAEVPPLVPRLHAWLVTDPAALVAHVGMDGGALEVITPSAADAVRWSDPISAWLRVGLDLVMLDQPSPPRVARELMLLAVGLQDGLLVAETARSQGHTVSEAALLAMVARGVLLYTHPIRTQRVEAEATVATWVGGADTVTVAYSRQLGAAVAESVVAFAHGDGADRVVPPSIRAPAPGVWQPTPPAEALPLEPGWGEVRPVGIGAAFPLRATPPPAWDDPTFVADRDAFRVTQHQLTDQDRALAQRWAGLPGTVTPPGQWIELGLDYAHRAGFDRQATGAMLATLAVALHDAMIACWESKFYYMVARPIQWMQMSDPAWQPLLTTPPFPSYPSGHATLSGAASAVVAAYLPGAAAEVGQLAEAIAWSRVVGGIHWSLDSKAGLRQGAAVGELVVTHVR